MFGTVHTWEKSAHIATVAALLAAGAGFRLGSKNNADSVHTLTGHQREFIAGYCRKRRTPSPVAVRLPLPENR
jgi:hypothetical protein